jgi:hypothetical protein
MPIALDTTAKTLEVLLGAAKTTNDCDYNVVYHDVAARSKADAHEIKHSHGSGATNGTGVVTLLSAPPNYTTRNVVYLSVHNADTVSQTVTVQVDTGGTNRVLIKKALSANETLVYEEGSGWQVL